MLRSDPGTSEPHHDCTFPDSGVGARHTESDVEGPEIFVGKSPGGKGRIFFTHCASYFRYRPSTDVSVMLAVNCKIGGDCIESKEISSAPNAWTMNERKALTACLMLLASAIP